MGSRRLADDYVELQLQNSHRLANGYPVQRRLLNCYKLQKKLHDVEFEKFKISAFTRKKINIVTFLDQFLSSLVNIYIG